MLVKKKDFKDSKGSLLFVQYNEHLFQNIYAARWAAFFEFCKIGYIRCDKTYGRYEGYPSFKLFDVESYHDQLKELYVFIEDDVLNTYFYHGFHARVEKFALDTASPEHFYEGKEVISVPFPRPSIVLSFFPPKIHYEEYMQDADMDDYSFGTIDGDPFECMPMPSAHKGKLFLWANHCDGVDLGLARKAYAYANDDSLFHELSPEESSFLRREGLSSYCYTPTGHPVPCPEELGPERDGSESVCEEEGLSHGYAF